MAKIFISYRRDDSAYAASMIYDKLGSHFGRDCIFMDVDTIPPGVDFREHIGAWIDRCDVVLALIGDDWVSACYRTGPRKGQRRLDDPGDFVRTEIQAALSRGIPVVPVLVGSATMPSQEELPHELSDLSFRNAIELRTGRDLQSQFDRLISDLQRLVGSPDSVGRTASYNAREPLQADDTAPALSKDLGSAAWLADAARDSQGRPSIGGISLLKRLGSGAGAMVYLGHHGRLDAKVVVKVFPKGWDSVGGTGFAQHVADARVLMKIKSENVARVLDINEDAGMTYVVQEYYEGVPATALIEKMGPNGLSEFDALAIVTGATRGMAAAHGVGVVHCDIKPANILIPYRSGETELDFLAAKLVDFGTAIVLSPDRGADAETSGITVGTPPYVAPERLLGGVVDRRIDVYAMGVCFYEMLAGRPPFRGESAWEMMRAIADGVITPITEYRQDLSGMTCALIQRCLSNEVDERYVDGAALLTGLQAVGADIGSSQAPDIED